MGSVLPAQLCEVREEGIYISFILPIITRVGDREKEEEKSTGERVKKRVNNDIVHIEGCKINSNK